MILTKDNFQIYAMKYYDNPYCLTTQEFEDDLNKIVTIKRSMTKFLQKDNVNVRLLVNNIITFYNVFEHHAASEMLSFKLDDQQHKHMNAILKYISLPLVGDGEIGSGTYLAITREFSDEG